MLIGGPRASAFGLCGAITIEADQSSFYRAPGWGADLTRSTRIPTNNSLDKKRGASKPPSKLKVLERTRCEKVRKQGATM